MTRRRTENHIIVLFNVQLVNRAAEVGKKKLKKIDTNMCLCISLKGGKQSKQNEEKHDEYSSRGSWIRLHE